MSRGDYVFDTLIVRNSLGEIIREDKKSEYDIAITEGIYLLNVAKRIDTIYLSKELGIKFRNVNDKEIEYIFPKISNQIENSMGLDYEKIIKFQKNYNGNLSEQENISLSLSNGIELNFDEFKLAFNFIYLSLMCQNGNMDDKVNLIKREKFDNINETAITMAKKVSSNFIVLEIENYQKLYTIFNKYYFLNNDVVRMNRYTENFVCNFVKFLNVIFLKNDSHKDETNFNFKLFEFEKYDFKIYDFISFYDGYFHNVLEDRKISKKLELINSKYIDSYIKNNNQNLNNLLFIVSRMIVEDDKSHEFNYREYNLNLITILELLLVNSKNENEVSIKFLKNIMVCLSINENVEDVNSESKIISAIYRYRSTILHGNYAGYTNAMSDLEKVLKYKPQNFELSKYNTIDYLISRKLNIYVSNVFEVISKNSTIIDILKN